MIERRRRKVRRMRGSRVHGYGRVSGGHRKSGQRGGKGKAGKRAHHWILTLIAKEQKKKGFTRHPGRSIKETINVGELDQYATKLVEDNLVTKDSEGRITINLSDFGIQKLLGSGRVQNAIVVEVQEASTLATEKIQEAKGEVLIS